MKEVKERLTKVESDVFFIKNEIVEVKEDIRNHIPTQIGELRLKMESAFEKIEQRFDANSRWLIGILVSLVFVLIGVVINFLKH